MKRIFVPSEQLGALVALVTALAAGCADDGDHDHGHDHDSEIISTVELTFTPEGGGDAVVASFTDPDGDGGMSGMSEPIDLVAGTSYELSIALLNDLEDPPEDIGAEVADEAEEHMFFIAGEGVMGPAADNPNALVTHDYADLESDYGDNAVGEDLPLGLVNTIVADQSGSSTMRVVLRHLPELNGEPQKSGALPQTFAEGGSLPGDVDVDVSFELDVQ